MRYFSFSIKHLILELAIDMATTNKNQSISIRQEEEINSLRDHFKDNIRILSSIGQFSYILKIRADQYDVSLTLQLDSKLKKKTRFYSIFKSVYY
jgi:hypothetical protein